ncbi:MAG: hypothetical protein Q7U63_01615 [Polaromonas sp.]|uniref:hypothetical protein n=1 Tax=Polaromonas sp. TaxID=1869339 RepID=UPI00271B4F04|nr:hypothetical protein [Polaromonas sp.]MDO9112471.1 hypothetical protein [Polaromonas sp.]MDP1887294.1 hypothetical protein [Polaromonas sp.]
MHIPPHDNDRIVRRAMELMGGHDAFFKAADEELADVNGRWNQNVAEIGRILRAHLFVEHYLTQYVAQANPRLGSLTEARATFAQKVALLDAVNPDIATMLPGIKRLNAIRNRLAHNLGTQVSEDDARIFLGCERFSALRAARSTEESQTNDPLEILEDFARHTAVSFTYEFTPLSKAIAQSIMEAQLGGAAI